MVCFTVNHQLSGTAEILSYSQKLSRGPEHQIYQYTHLAVGSDITKLFFNPVSAQKTFVQTHLMLYEKNLIMNSQY